MKTLLTLMLTMNLFAFDKFELEALKYSINFDQDLEELIYRETNPEHLKILAEIKAEYRDCGILQTRELITEIIKGE